MVSRNLRSSFLFSKYLNYCKNVVFFPQRGVQVSLVGSTNDIGANLSLLLKQNSKIDKLHLYDDDVKVKGMAIELSHIPGGPEVCAWAGDASLCSAVQNSHVIVMTYRVPRKPGHTREQMIAANAPAVLKLCRAMANQNSEAFFAIATNPINSMVPFASALMYKYGCYNPLKILGVTHVDVARTRMLTAGALKINPGDIWLPVIGGHSDETVVPLFSNMHPVSLVVDPYKADTLTRLVRKAGTEVVYQKQGKESATLTMAVSIHEFIDLIIDAVKGNEVTVNSYSANPNFGTRFFSGPTKVGQYGITEACPNNYQYSDYEEFLLNASVPHINRDVELGENYIRFIEMVGSQ